jgi:hypothetical protein
MPYENPVGRCCILGPMLRSFFLCGLLSLVASAPLRAAGACSQDDLRKASAPVKAIRAQLLALRVQQMDATVSPSTQQSIREMKDSLTAAVDAYMRCEQVTVDVSLLQNALAAQLDANKPENTAPVFADSLPESQDQVYGADLKIIVRKPDARLDLIAIQASFGVKCGEDTMLLMYSWRGRQWRQGLRWQSGDYDAVDGAFGDFFQYVVMPQGPAGDVLAAIAHGHPWCTSRWSGFALDVVRLAGPSAPQQILLHRDDGYDRGPDLDKFLPRMKNEPDGFELRVRDSSLDHDVFSKGVIYRYRVAGNGLRRVQPVALNGRDFVDVWIESSWAEAADWSSADNLDSLKVEHERIEKLNRETGESSPAFSFGAVRSCSQDPNIFQVELDQDPGAPTYFQIRQRQNSFTMLSASEQSDSHCKSGNLIGKRFP